jgi:hypothetical protein
MKRFAPSNYGVSDFLHDAILIRVPYRKGIVWKWYAYWGSLVLERTASVHAWFRWPRTVANDWMSRPHGITTTENNAGHVHLGFWAMWASPEGFAGYDRDGNLPDGSHARIIQDVRDALKRAGDRDIEVYVVGHSLGGAVSWYASQLFHCIVK